MRVVTQRSIMKKGMRSVVGVLLGAGAIAAMMGSATNAQSVQNTPPRVVPPASVTAGRTGGPAAASEVPTDFRIGIDDVLTVAVYQNKDLTGDFTVRPDGKITMFLINDVQAAGLTPDELRQSVVKALAAGDFIHDPTVTVQVKEIHSLKVSIMGSGVAKTGEYPLKPHMTVLNLITLAGGLTEYAKKDKISIIRVVNGKQTLFKFNYDDVQDQKVKALAQNIELKAGDVVIVP
jgi:polysaccharide export outer membrane protein